MPKFSVCNVPIYLDLLISYQTEKLEFKRNVSLLLEKKTNKQKYREKMEITTN